jgi:hypothetical protein
MLTTNREPVSDIASERVWSVGFETWQFSIRIVGNWHKARISEYHFSIICKLLVLSDLSRKLGLRVTKKKSVEAAVAASLMLFLYVSCFSLSSAAPLPSALR